MADYMPRTAVEYLRGCGCELWFPLVVQDALYGIYFLPDRPLFHSTGFQLALTSLNQTLSAVRLISQQDEACDRLKQKVIELEREVQIDNSQTASSSRMLKLVRHRSSEVLIGKIVQEVSRDLDLTRSLFLYRGEGEDRPIRAFRRGIDESVSVPGTPVFDSLLARLGPDKLEPVTTLQEVEGPLAALAADLKQAGLEYVAPFPLSSNRGGIIAFNGGRDPDQTFAELKGHGLSAAELMANAESFEEVEALSYTDSLTGLANHRYFKRRLEEEIGRAARYGRSLALIIFDLDELKSVNDCYGHQAGDRVIQQMGEALTNSTRSIDVVARYGGDEFCIVMPESDRATCARFMRRLQLKIASTKFHLNQLDKELACTISQGGAIYPEDGTTPEQLIYSADMALLKAKEGGRDKFVIA
jgi:diguanylate cyclase (GGDEF)-like protein